MNRNSIGRLALPLVLGLYAICVLSYWEPACVAPDAVGLCQQARHFAESGVVPFRPESPAQFVGTHWVETDDSTYWGRFPPGYPVALGVGYRLAGPGWALLLGPLLGIAAVGLLFGIGKTVWPRRSQPGETSSGLLPAILSGLLLATLPLQNRLALHGDTHVPALACMLAGVWALLRWDRDPSRVRAFAAGLAWGLLPSLRYGEAVLSFAAGAFMVLRVFGSREETARRRTLCWAAGGAGPPLALLGVFNTVAYGTPWRTGYALTAEQAAFSFQLVPGHLSFYLASLLSQPAVAATAAFGVWALGLMILNRDTRPSGLFLLSATLLSALLYTSYYWGELEYPPLALRFFLPALALLIVAVSWLLSHARGRRGWLVRAVVVGLILFGAVQSEPEMREEGLALEGGGQLVSATRQAIPPGSVVICPRGLGETLSYTGLWHIVPQWLFPGDPERDRIVVPWEVTPEMARGRTLRAAPMQASRGAVLRTHYRDLPDSALVHAVLADVRRWQPLSEVYWVGDPSVVGRADRFLSNQGFRALGYLVLPGRPEREADAEGPSRLPPRIPLFILEPVSGSGRSAP
jgi:hypothetical protein